ncbi:endonuclease V [Xylocopilactobacillus apicola]|uniref:Endonuclease V n=1 Tax=Xylocopilactobacillus apicola TaxID=2932184 RepID=A0AAU9CW91_9LACO|nr:endonuclease V [Xylocopilactobacillus apicola]BDR58229.1 endonuclease V [Xylocopilactobacillus apicola]
MKLAIDVYYYPDRAKAVGILFENWKQSEPDEIITAFISDVAKYEPGSFYKRELPCILELLKQVDMFNLELIIVDGFVYVDNDQKAGLGKHLFDALNEEIPIIGVAKNPFAKNKKLVREITRGESKKPLYISSVGISILDSASNIQNMQGDFRMPTLLKMLDQETKR